jgi:hypothetical protein
MKFFRGLDNMQFSDFYRNQFVNHRNNNLTDNEDVEITELSSDTLGLKSEFNSMNITQV